MRLYEIHGFGACLTEEMLLEGFLDSVKRSLGDKVNQTVATVSNSVSALQVLYKVASNEQFRSSVTAQLNKQIRTKLKGMGNGPVVTKFKEILNQVWSAGSKLMDFLKSLVIFAVVNVVEKAVNKVRKAINGVEKAADVAKKIAIAAAGETKAEVTDWATEQVMDIGKKLLNIESMINRLTSASGIFQLFEWLGVANEVVFDMLNYINRKLDGPGAIKIST